MFFFFLCKYKYITYKYKVVALGEIRPNPPSNSNLVKPNI